MRTASHPRVSGPRLLNAEGKLKAMVRRSLARVTLLDIQHRLLGEDRQQGTRHRHPLALEEAQGKMTTPTGPRETTDRRATTRPCPVCGHSTRGLPPKIGEKTLKGLLSPLAAGSEYGLRMAALATIPNTAPMMFKAIRRPQQVQDQANHPQTVVFQSGRLLQTAIPTQTIRKTLRRRGRVSRMLPILQDSSRSSRHHPQQTGVQP